MTEKLGFVIVLIAFGVREPSSEPVQHPTADGVAVEG